MARARLLKPGFFTNEELSEVPMEGRLLFAGLWTLADRDGRLEDRPRRIKAAVFPYDEVAVDALLGELTDRGFIQRYAADGHAYIQVSAFQVHQRIHPNEPRGHFPPPPANGDTATAIGSHWLPMLPEAEAEAEALTGSGSGSGSGKAAAAAREEPTDEADVVLAIRAWERATGATITAQIADALEGAIASYTLETVVDAIEETGASGAKSWKYTAAVLDNWRRNGKRNGNAPKGEYGVFHEPKGGWKPEEVPEAPPDTDDALRRGRVWRAVLQRMDGLDPPISEQLRGSAWVGMEGDMAIVQARSSRAAVLLFGLEHVLASLLSEADPGTVFEGVEVRWPGWKRDGGAA